MEHFSISSFKPKTNYVIEASAGTGKTYNIVQIVKKLVNEYGFDLNEILIVTYTDKAAGELKDRIRKGLKGQDVDNAPIYTIHSFCQNAIKCFGISAALPLSLNVINDEELYDFAERYVREGDILKDITSVIASIPDFSYDRLISLLVQALNKYYLGMTYQEDPRIIELEPLSEEFQALIELSTRLREAKRVEDLFDVHEDLKTNYLIFKNSSEPKAQEFCQELADTLSTNFSFSGRKFTVKTKWSSNPTVDAELKQAFDFFKELKEFLAKFKSHVYTFLTTRYLADFYQKWQLEKETNKNQTFNDMIRFVRESVLIDDGPMLANLRAKYKYAIIDEFQDTNQIQFDIFSRIFLCDGHNIIVVGDPKQSIYSFQGADIEVYHKAKKIIGENGGLICDLNKNYRSTSDMVNSCNGLFTFYNFHGTQFEDCDSLSESVDGSEHKVLYEGKPVNAFWIATEELDEKQFAQIAVEAIVDCCRIDETGKTKLQVKGKDDEDFRNVTFRDFAVLARSRSEMTPIEANLREVGIPFMRYKDQSLFTGKECADWIALLSALDMPDFTGKNRKAFKKTLFTQFFSQSIKTAADEIYSTDDNEPIRLVKKWRSIAGERKWEDLFDDIIVESGLLERMTSLSQMQSLGIYKQIANFSVEYLSNNHSIEELIKYLTGLAAGKSGDDPQNGPIVEKSTNFDSVQVMTMHASKGLQFPVVIAVCGFKNPVDNDVYTYHLIEDDQERHILGFEGNDQTAFEETEEWKRLFYVGYTRAQFIMMLPNYGKNFSKGKDFLKESILAFIGAHQDKIKVLSPSGNDLSVLKPDVKDILEKQTASAETADTSTKAEQDATLKKIIRIVPARRAYKHSYSSFSHASFGSDDEGETDDEKIEGLEKYDSCSSQIVLQMDPSITHDLLPSGYPKGARAGSALHEIFEKIDFMDYANDLEAIIFQAFKNQHIRISDANIKATVTLVQNVLSAKLPVIQGSASIPGSIFSLSSISKANKRAEVEFNFNYEDEWLKNYCNGFIDLLFKLGDYYCLLDWKSDSLSETFLSYSDNNELKRHVDESYSIQRVLYSYCLIKWLKGFYKELTEEEIFQQHFGGIYYVFLRGCSKGTANGVYCQTWSSWSDLKAAFDFIISDRTGGAKND